MDLTETINYLSDRMHSISGTGVADTKVNMMTEGTIIFGIRDAMSSGYVRRGEKTLFMYDGRRYVKLEEDALKTIIAGLLERNGIGTVYKANSVEKIRKNLLMSGSIPEFNASKSLVSFNNKVLNIEDMTSHDHSEKYMTRVHIDVDYDPKAQCPNWNKFLMDVLPDRASVMVMQEFFGLAFVDRKKLNMEGALFLCGTGSNGKGVVESVIRGIFGEENCSSFTLEQLCKKMDSSYSLAQANGKLVNFASDMSDSDFSGGTFKAIASGEPVMVRNPTEKPFMAKDMPILACNINKTPITTDSSNGHWRRQIMISFEKTIADEDQDKELKYNLRKEYSGILNWIIEGSIRIRRQKGQYTHSDKIEETRERARTDSSPVLLFIKENNWVGKLKDGQNGILERKFASTIMDEYNAFCLNGNFGKKSRSNLKADLMQAGFQYRERLRICGEVNSGWEFYHIYDAQEEESKPTNTVPF